MEISRPTRTAPSKVRITSIHLRLVFRRRRKADPKHREQANPVNPGERDQHQAQHPCDVQHQHGGPAKRGEFRQAQRSRVTVTRDLFNAEVALAHDQLPDLEGEEQRGQEEQDDHGNHDHAFSGSRQD